MHDDRYDEPQLASYPSRRPVEAHGFSVSASSHRNHDYSPTRFVDGLEALVKNNGGGSRMSSVSSTSTPPFREGSEGSRSGNLPSSSNSQPQQPNRARLNNQSDWIKLPSVSYGLSFHADMLPREPLFSLVLRQQPKRGLAIGSSQMALRTARSVPLDPPPVCELIMNQRGNEHTLSLPEVFVRAQLVQADSAYDEVLPDARRNEPLVGDTLQSPFNSRIECREDQSFFVFKELGVRNKGVYRLRFDLYDRVGLSIQRVAFVCSDAFEVFERRRHPGLSASSLLMDALVDRGMKYKLRKPVEPKASGKKRKSDYEDEQVEGSVTPNSSHHAQSLSQQPSGVYLAAEHIRQWRQNGHEPRFSASPPQEGRRLQEPRLTQMGPPVREVSERPRPILVPRILESPAPWGLADPRPSRECDHLASFRTAPSDGNKRPRVSSYQTRQATEDRATDDKVVLLRPRPNFPERKSSSSLSGSSLSTNRTGSALSTPRTPASVEQPMDEDPSPQPAAGQTRLPGIAHFLDSAQLHSTPPGSRQASSSRSPTWLPPPLDLLKRRSSDPRFSDRPF